MGPVVEELRRVGTGLRMVFLGLLAVVVNAVAGIAIVATLGDMAKGLEGAVVALNRDHPAAMTVLIGLGVLASVLDLAGKVYCLSAPQGAQAQGLILMAVACGGLALLASVAGHVGDPGEAGAEMALLSAMTSVMGYLFFVRFLGRLAAFLGSSRLVARVRQVQAGTLAIAAVVLTAWLGATAGAMHVALLLAMPLILVGVPIVFGLYSWLVHDLRLVTEAAADYADEGEGA